MKHVHSAPWGSLLGCLLLCLGLVPTASAQQTQGTVTVTVLDSTGAVVPGALLELTDLATNDARTATTQEAGTYTFVNLTFGRYKLTVSLQGFTTQSLDVLVQSARTTDVKATLKVGGMQDVVQVEGDVAPLIETTSNAINTTIDMKQIEDLPLGGRDISQLSRLTAGYNGTWNGLPSAAQGNTVDGIIGNTTRWRYQSLDSARSTAITPRLENIAEMAVSTDQIDMNQGFGNSSMQITYVTRRGSNEFHGRLFEDFRAQFLNANNWNSTVKPTYHQNEFGASLGGPIVPGKLFFFGSGSALDIPGSTRTTRTFLDAAAKQGIFTYGNGAQANLFNIFAAYNAANGTAFPASASQINPMVAARIAEVDGYRQNAGVLSAPALQPTDPNLRQWEWQYANSQRTYYPTFRVDYNMSPRWRMNVAYNQSKYSAPSTLADHWPGDGRGAGNKSNNASVALGLQTILAPTLVNEVKGGWLYTSAAFGIGGSDGFYTSPNINYGYGNYNDYYELPNSRKQPIYSVSDSMTWLKGSHTLRFGGNAYREVNQYWDPPEGYTLMSLGLVEGDPALDVLTKQAMQAAAGPGAPLPTDAEWQNAQQLYAMLSGRISDFWGRHAYLPGTGSVRDREHAGLQRSRLLHPGRTADVLGAVRPGLLPAEAELHGQHGPALGLRLARQGPHREVSLADAAGSLRPDRRRQSLQPRIAVADRHLRSDLHRTGGRVRALERHAPAGGGDCLDAARRRQLYRTPARRRQVGGSRRLLVPAVHHAAAVRVGHGLVVRPRVLPELRIEPQHIG